MQQVSLGINKLHLNAVTGDVDVSESQHLFGKPTGRRSDHIQSCTPGARDNETGVVAFRLQMLKVVIVAGKIERNGMRF